MSRRDIAAGEEWAGCGAQSRGGRRRAYADVLAFLAAEAAPETVGHPTSLPPNDPSDGRCVRYRVGHEASGIVEAAAKSDRHR